MEDRHPDQESGHLGSSLSDAPDFAGQLQASHVPSQDLSSSCVKGGPDALMSTVPPGALTARLPPRRTVLGGSPLRSPSGPPLPAPHPPAPHPEPFLLVRLDLGVQLPQRVRKAAEEQILPDQLVSALHSLRHRCASAVSGRDRQEAERRGLAARGGAGRRRQARHAAARLAARTRRATRACGPAPVPPLALPSHFRQHQPPGGATALPFARLGFQASLAPAL